MRPIDGDNLIERCEYTIEHGVPDADGLHAIAVEAVIAVVKGMPTVQPEEGCDTCKHGYFGDSHCDNCRVRYPSHYERRTDG